MERVVYDLGIEFIRQGHDVTLFACKGSHMDGARVIETVEPMDKVQADWMEYERRHFEMYKPYMPEFAGDDCIINDHTWFYHSIYIKKDNPDVNFKICKTQHGMMAWPSPPPIKYPCMIGISDHHSLDTALKLQRCVRRAYNPVPMDIYPFKEEKSDRYLFMSRITPFKGVDIAIDLAKKCRIPIDIAGGTSFVEDPSYVMKMQQQCDGRMIKWHGEVSHEKKIEMYQNAKALINVPGRGFVEPFGLVAVEAQACGTPVITFDNGALKETVKNGESGFIRKDVDGLAEVINNDKVSKIKPINCRKNAERFSCENSAKRYIELYTDMINGLNW